MGGRQLPSPVVATAGHEQLYRLLLDLRRVLAGLPAVLSVLEVLFHRLPPQVVLLEA
jgi:hypothetical protein